MLLGREEAVSTTLDAVAKRLEVPITSVALAYAMTKAPNVFPVIGGYKIAQLKANVEALGLRLSREDVEEIEKGYAFEAGFPHDFIGIKGKVPGGGTFYPSYFFHIRIQNT